MAATAGGVRDVRGMRARCIYQEEDLSVKSCYGIWQLRAWGGAADRK